MNDRPGAGPPDNPSPMDGGAAKPGRPDHQERSPLADNAPTQDQLFKFFLEIGPLVLFFGTYLFFDDLMAATAVLMVAVPVAVGITYMREKRVPIMPLVTMVMVLVFGGLTLILQDETFIKMKPTIVNGLFASALFGGLLFGKALLKPLFGPVFQLDEAGWKKLSFRWALFFVFLGVLNEVVWRTQSESTWVYYKVWGVMPLTIIFALSQMPLINRHTVEPTAPAAGTDTRRDD